MSSERPVHRVALSAASEQRGVVAAAIRSDHQLLGVIEHTLTSDGRHATIQRVELEPAFRGWGYGTEAVRLLEARLAAEGVESVAAPVEIADGLGLYFWLRLGYRPARDDTTGSAGIIMERGLVKA
jgi:GNAT superfamily N-acetyltransferase